MRAAPLLRHVRRRQDRHRSPNWPRTIAWRNARRVQVRQYAKCSVPGCRSPGWLEAHDIIPYAELTDAQRRSFEFLRANMITFCRQHHAERHPHLSP